MGKFMQTHNHYLNTTFTIIMAVITIPTHTIYAMCYQCFCCIVNTFIFNIMKVSSSYFLTHIHSSSFYVLAANVIMIIFSFNSIFAIAFYFLIFLFCILYISQGSAHSTSKHHYGFHLCISLTIRIVFCFYFSSFPNVLF